MKRKVTQGSMRLKGNCFIAGCESDGPFCEVSNGSVVLFRTCLEEEHSQMVWYDLTSLLINQSQLTAEDLKTLLYEKFGSTVELPDETDSVPAGDSSTETGDESERVEVRTNKQEVEEVQSSPEVHKLQEPDTGRVKEGGPKRDPALATLDDILG